MMFYSAHIHSVLLFPTVVRETEEHFDVIPAELCCLKIVGFSKDIGSSLSLLPSLMHRLESLLLAVELKDVMSRSFREASEISGDCVRLFHPNSCISLCEHIYK